MTNEEYAEVVNHLEAAHMKLLKDSSIPYGLEGSKIREEVGRAKWRLVDYLFDVKGRIVDFNGDTGKWTVENGSRTD